MRSAVLLHGVAGGTRIQTTKCGAVERTEHVLGLGITTFGAGWLRRSAVACATTVAAGTVALSATLAGSFAALVAVATIATAATTTTASTTTTTAALAAFATTV